MSHAQKTLYVRPINRKAVADAIRGIVPKLKGATLFEQESCDVTAVRITRQKPKFKPIEVSAESNEISQVETKKET
ncbi:MAG: hypothetical protein GY841_02740 [FCB group bacterium]|nr:hypothetical protein [FCB group bacterium]